MEKSNSVYQAARFLEWYEKNMVELNPPPELKVKLAGVLYWYAESLKDEDWIEKQNEKIEKIGIF